MYNINVGYTLLCLQSSRYAAVLARYALEYDKKCVNYIDHRTLAAGVLVVIVEELALFKEILY